HAAGVHNPHQTKFTGEGDQSAGCATCHREHRGGASIARLADSHCTACHADVPTDDGQHRFAQSIDGFDTAHPEFGAWRGGELRDPGTLKFNHKAHLDLAAAYDAAAHGRNAWMGDAMKRLK